MADSTAGQRHRIKVGQIQAEGEVTITVPSALLRQRWKMVGSEADGEQPCWSPLGQRIAASNEEGTAADCLGGR